MTINVARDAGIGLWVFLVTLAGLWAIASSLSVPIEEDAADVQSWSPSAGAVGPERPDQSN